jgi:hypothetical protein
MSVTIHCPHCGATGNAPDHIIGQSVRCSKCKKQFVAGGEEESEIPEEEPVDDFDDMDDDAPPPSRRRGGRSRSGGGGGGGSGFADFATFRVLVAPRFIVIVFWVLVALYFLLSLVAIAGSLLTGQVIPILIGLILVPLSFLLGCLFLRLGMEAMIVQFRIYEVLKEMNSKTK